MLGWKYLDLIKTFLVRKPLQVISYMTIISFIDKIYVLGNPN